MFKRIFWFAVGFAAGVITVSKASSYVKAHTPQGAREFILGADQDNVPMRTLSGLVEDFMKYQKQREDELNKQYITKYNR